MPSAKKRYNRSHRHREVMRLKTSGRGIRPHKKIGGKKGGIHHKATRSFKVVEPIYERPNPPLNPFLALG